MTTPRYQTIVDREAIYHCTSRCVRRAFLCGEDGYTGKNYDHRKDWVRDRLILFSEVFTIDILGCALMGNHEHLMLRTRPDLLSELSEEEVARRWLKLFPKSGFDGEDEEVVRLHVDMMLIYCKRMKILRERLGSISWFMKSLNEYIARKANKEDDCKGRFWEGRFKCQRLDSNSAIVSCAMYIDLNPIRAGTAISPETSEYTSAYERINAFRQSQQSDLNTEPNLWLSPVQNTDTRKGFLNMTLSEYLELLDATGKAIKRGKKGKIPHNLKPILERLGVRSSLWIQTIGGFGRNFSFVVGCEENLVAEGKRTGKKWIKGIRFARRCFI